MKRLVLVRHGESLWNKENKFTGWTDIELSKKGIEEAKEAGKLLKEKGYIFDMAYSSVLKRANDTLDYILEELKQTELKIIYSYKLNERHYGALQGLNKEETGKKYGQEQLMLWRRSANTRPPLLDKNDDRYPGNEEKYKNITEELLPLGESLNDTITRVSEYYNNVIKESFKNNDTIIVVAHGNSIRGLIKYLDNLTDEEVIKLEIPTGKPLCYELNKEINAIRRYYI